MLLVVTERSNNSYRLRNAVWHRFVIIMNRKQTHKISVKIFSKKF